jgi:uncharacterized membrane protein YeiH
MIYFLDLLGTFAFAITGSFRAKGKNLHIFAAIFLGIITAVGGGTFRDVAIDRLPLFYLKDPAYLSIAIVGGILTYAIPTFFKKGYIFFRFIDSVGLAAFVIIGTSIAHSHLFSSETFPSILSFVVCIFLGMLTGFGGGVVRDAILAETPFSLRHGSNYLESAFWGAFSFYILMFINVSLAILISMAITLLFREILSKYGIYKKVLRRA